MKGVSSCGAPGEAASTSRGQWRDNEAIRRGRDVRRVDTHHPPLKGTNITWQSVSLMRDWREQKKSDAALVVRVSTLRKMCTTTEEEEKRNKKKTNEKATSRPALGRQCSVRQNEPEFYATVWRNSGTTATDWRQKTNGWIGSTHIQLQRTKALEDAMDQSEHRLSIPKMRLERQVNVIY